MTPAPRPLHNRIAFMGAALLEPRRTARDGMGDHRARRRAAGDGDYVQPEVVFVRRDREGIITDRGIEGAPHLVMEVLSRSTFTRDRGIKRERYALHGVPEYWIVDADARLVEVYRLRDDAERPEIATERLRWEPVEGGPVLELDLVDLFADLE